MTKKYTLTMNEEQAQLLVKALDLYSRIGIGQFEEVLQVYDPTAKLSPGTRDDIRQQLDFAKAAAGHPANGSYGIHSPEVRDEFRAAYDIQQVVRNRLAYDRKPEGNPSSVHFDEPRQISKVPLPTIVSSNVGQDADGFYYCAKHAHEQTVPCPECNPA